MGQVGDEPFHQQILNSILSAVVVRDSKGTVTFWNRFAESLLGWEAEEILGKSIRVILPDDELGDKHPDVLQFMSLETAWSSVLSLRRKNGDLFAAQVTASAIGTTGGKLTGSVYVIVPITDRERSEVTTETEVLDGLFDNVVQSANREGHEEAADSRPAGASLLSRVLDTLPIGVSVANKDGQIVLSNPAEQRIWEDSTNKDLEQHGSRATLTMEDGQPAAPDDWALARAIQNGEVTLNQILEIEGVEGGRKTILSSAAPLRNQKAEIIGGIVVHQDITEQRRIEEAERKHRTLANALSNITATLTSSLNLQTVMERILENVGRVVPREAANIMLIENDMVRIAFWHNYGPKCDETFRKNRYPLDIPMLAHMLNTGLPVLISDTRSAPDWVTFEETAWIRSSVGVPIRARDAILGFLILDSSEPDFFKPPDAERLRAFAYQAAIAIENARLFSRVQEYATELEMRVQERTVELHAAKDHVEAILEHSSDGFALVNEDGVITQVNPSFRQLFGINQRSADTPTLFVLAHQNARERLKVAFHDARRNEKSYRIELACYRLDGSTFDADMAIAPLLDATKKTYFYICNVRDITKQKTAERELRTALEHEKQLGELKSRFVAMVSHEFRTPLATIQTSSDLLYRYFDRLTTERRNEIILRIQSQIRRLAVLLEDVLTVAKADTFGLVLELRIVDLKALCAEVVREFGYSIAQNRAVDFQAPADSLPVELDSKLIQQVVTNLLSNAVKYSSEESRIDLMLRATETQAIIEIRDQGIGIPNEDMPGLFDPFYRAHNVGARPGTGLGLAVVKRAVEAHHGTVAVESEQGIGTRFIVTIPKRQPIIEFA